MAEAQRPEIQTDFDEVRGKLAAAVEELVGRAQTAWDGGVRLLAPQFPLAPDPLPLVRHLPDLAHEYRILDETVWNDALNRIVDIGWHAHSWTIGRGDHPIPLFKRPE